MHHVTSSTPHVVALIPAYDEVVDLPEAVAALRSQTRPPDRIVVVVNNPVGDIEAVARATGAEVEVIVHCPDLKAGALNSVLRRELQSLRADDYVLIQDADSFLDPHFVESALAAYGDDVGGVGGVFRGRVDAPTVGQRLLQRLQSNEYARYELDIKRQKGRVLVLTGTATLLRVAILREVVRARGDGRLPAGVGDVYDTKVLTEDNELSFALLHLGYRIVSPADCTLSTETMPTLHQLAKQRNRWKRGALENLFDYGWTRHTRSYWNRQALALMGLVITAAYLSSMVYGAMHGLQLHPFWAAVTALFVLERMVTVRRRGWRMIGLASLLIVEMTYDLFLQLTQARAFWGTALRTQRTW